MGKTGKTEDKTEVIEHTALDKILGDEHSQSEGSYCGRVCKRIAPSAMVVLCGIAVGVFGGMGYYFSIPKCPPNMCIEHVGSSDNQPIISANMFLLMTACAVITAVNCVFDARPEMMNSEWQRLLTESEHSEKDESCCRRTWKCITNKLIYSPKAIATASAIMMGFLSVMGVYFALPKCPDPLCLTPDKKVTDWVASRNMYLLMGVFILLTKVTCVFGDTLAGKRNCACL